MNKLVIPIERVREEETRLKGESGFCYEPPILSPKIIEKFQLSSPFVKSHEYLRKHYQMLSEKYKDQTWLIINESGVIAHSSNHDVIFRTFHGKGYADSAILTCIRKNGGVRDNHVKIPIQ